MKVKLDQHFMINEEIIDKIVNYLEIQENETILEIGAGTGNLTRELKGKIIVVEIDKNLIKELEKIENSLSKNQRKTKFGKAILVIIDVKKSYL